MKRTSMIMTMNPSLTVRETDLMLCARKFLGFLFGAGAGGRGRVGVFFSPNKISLALQRPAIEIVVIYCPRVFESYHLARRTTLATTATTQGKKRKVWEATQESFLSGFLEEKVRMGLLYSFWLD